MSALKIHLIAFLVLKGEIKYHNAIVPVIIILRVVSVNNAHQAIIIMRKSLSALLVINIVNHVNQKVQHVQSVLIN